MKSYVSEKLESNAKKLSHEVQSMIPNTNIYQNSINVAVGKPNSGKSVALLCEIIKISQLHQPSHLLVVVNKDGSPNDPTINLFRPDITIPIVFIARSEISSYLKQLLEYKDLYNEVKANHLVGKIEDSQRDEMFKNLFITDYSKTYLHTLIFIEDSGKSKVFKEGGYLSSILVECRHIQCSFFITIQSWKMISPDLKSYIGTIFIFTGFSRERLRYIYRQLNVNDDWNEFSDDYYKLSNTPGSYIMVDNFTGLCTINE
jgi:hypothetical protein